MKRLILFLVTSFSLSISNPTWTIEYSGINGSADDLSKLFDIETEFLSEGWLMFRALKSGFQFAEKYQCSVIAHVQYVEGNRGFSVAYELNFKPYGHYDFSLFDEDKLFLGQLNFSYRIERGGCKLKPDLTQNRVYYFDSGVLTEALKK